MSEPTERSVCDLTLVMRTRLLCGLFNRRAVPPRWRRLAQAYCVIVALAFLSYTYFFRLKFTSLLVFLYWLIGLIEYILSILFSVWTGDEYIYTFFTQNPITDITLDSSSIFKRLQKRIHKAYVFAYLPYTVVYIGLNMIVWSRLGLIAWMVLVIPAVFIDLNGTSISTTKLLVMALFDARLLVLKRRLQRHGFHITRHKQPQPYCEIYDEILQGLDATDNPLKVLLFFDLVFGSCKIILYLLIALMFTPWQDREGAFTVTLIVYHVINLSKILACSFGHIVLLESAAAHCEYMAVFTATQLIKTPTSDERLRMREFLDALEQRGARYRVLRALPLDARLLWQVISFCSAQVIVFAKSVDPYDPRNHQSFGQ